VGAFQIDAFEPNLKNNLRFCESVIMNGWEHEHMVAGPKKSANIHIWPVGLSDTTGTKEFYEWNGNPGAGHFDHPGHTRTDGTELPVTTLDRFAQEQGWFDSQSQSRPTSIPILKIDVEHHETNVLAGAAKLLQSGLVQNIFLDLFQDEASDRESKLRTLELLANSGYKLKAHGQWSGPDKPSPWENDENLANNMMAYLESEHIQNWNLWWTL
jgi:FkbM family methyltransferase